MGPGRLRSLLVADDSAARRRGIRWTAVVAAFGLSLWGLLWVLNGLAVVLPLDVTWLVVALALMSVGPAAVFAHRHGGLLVCLALGSALPVVLYLVPAAIPSMAPDESFLWGLYAGLTFGVPAGTIGFVLGLGTREMGAGGRAGS